MKAKRKNRGRGATIAEAGAALGLLLPLAFTVIFVVLEASYAYMIKSSLSQASRQAARDLAIAYGQNPSIQSDRSLQNVQVFDNIRIKDMVADSAQFEDPTFQTASDPPTVSVTVRYLGGQHGLPPFPNPDPLHLGSSFQITANSTYRLEYPQEYLLCNAHPPYGLQESRLALSAVF
jgi:hypothetical protein